MLHKFPNQDDPNYDLTEQQSKEFSECMKEELEHFDGAQTKSSGIYITHADSLLAAIQLNREIRHMPECASRIDKECLRTLLRRGDVTAKFDKKTGEFKYESNPKKNLGQENSQS